MTLERSKDVGVRQVIELAISTGRTWQSPQTGYVQYCPFQAEEEEHHTTPLYENLLFVLSLFRSKSVDNVNEAKTALKKLLSFQTKEGAFPRFIHEYPGLVDHNACFFLFLPLFLIRKSFFFTFEKEWGEEFDKKIQALFSYAFSQEEKFSLPYTLRAILASAALGFSEIYNDAALEKKGRAIENTLFSDEKDPAWGSPSTLGHLYAAAQMAGKKRSEKWLGFFFFLEVVWHPFLKAYAGPSMMEFWKGDYPEPTLLDLVMGMESGGFPSRIFQNTPLLLEGALLDKEVEEPKEQKEQSFHLYTTAFKGFKSLFCKGKDYAAAALFKENNETETKKGFLPFCLLFGDQFGMHSIVAEGPARLFDAYFEENKLITKWEIDYPASNDEKEGDLCFFFEDRGDLEWLVGSEKATVFRLGESIYIKAAGMTWRAVFYLEEGSGTFVGQVLKGNRSSQIMTKGKHRYTAFDWVFSLRTVRRSYPCVLRLDFERVS